MAVCNKCRQGALTAKPKVEPPRMWRSGAGGFTPTGGIKIKRGNPHDEQSEIEGGVVLCRVCYEDLMARITKYEDLEKQRRIVVLPCKVGDTVYCINPYCGECENTDEFAKVIDVNAQCPIAFTKKCAMMIDEELFDYCHIPDFGKTVFLTKPEAQAALNRM